VSAPAVVLLHAFPLDHRLWQPQADRLRSAGARVVVPDLPGFGGDPLPASEPSLDVVAELLLAELDSLGIDECVLGGSSLGGYVTMALLRRRPRIARAVVLSGTKATADNDEARANRVRLARMVLDLPSECGRILEQAVLPGLLGSTSFATRPGVVAEVRSWLNAASADTVAWYQRAMAARPDSLATLAGIDAPALVVWGEEDALSSRSEQELMVDAMDECELALIEGAGHLSGVERPDAVSAIIDDFVQSVTGPRPS